MVEAIGRDLGLQYRFEFKPAATAVPEINSHESETASSRSAAKG
jgi:hypothetical protein